MENIDKYSICGIIILIYFDGGKIMADRKGRNLVIGGDYIAKFLGGVGKLTIRVGIIKSISLDKNIVESYEIKDEQPMNDLYVVLFKFKDGKKSLIEMDGERFMVFKRIFEYSID